MAEHVDPDLQFLAHRGGQLGELGVDVPGQGVGAVINQQPVDHAQDLQHTPCGDLELGEGLHGAGLDCFAGLVTPGEAVEHIPHVPNGELLPAVTLGQCLGVVQ